MRWLLLIFGCFMLTAGCAVIPEKVYEPRYHNPFPQLSRVAVLPFFNQSGEPVLDGFAIANLYRNELQKIPGFEVMPVGVVERYLVGLREPLDQRTDFQKLAQQLNVDAVVVGSITDFSEYYPPKIGIAVNWYAANPSFHQIPPGYGLPWNSAEEEFIPDSLLLEAEFALAREQLKTQTPTLPPMLPAEANRRAPEDKFAPPKEMMDGSGIRDSQGSGNRNTPGTQTSFVKPNDPNGLASWPDESAFLPQPPSPERPLPCPQRGPIIELIKQYNGNDSDFTDKLANYYTLRDDERAGGWRSYLQRKDDFIRFCCHLHITEMLAARGGAGETRVVWRWPTSRYDH